MTCKTSILAVVTTIAIVQGTSWALHREPLEVKRPSDRFTVARAPLPSSSAPKETYISITTPDGMWTPPGAAMPTTSCLYIPEDLLPPSAAAMKTGSGLSVCGIEKVFVMGAPPPKGLFIHMEKK